MLAGDLFDLVSSHFSLKEKEYFGLYFVDDTYVQPDATSCPAAAAAAATCDAVRSHALQEKSIAYWRGDACTAVRWRQSPA